MKKIYLFIILLLFILKITGNNSSLNDSLRILIVSTEDNKKALVYFDIAKSLLTDSANVSFNYIQKGIFFAKKFNNKSHLCYLYKLQGTYYFKKDQYDSALVNYSKSLHIANELNLEKDIMQNTNNIAAIYDRQGKFAKSIENYNEVLEYHLNKMDSVNISRILNNLGSVYLKIKDFNKAFSILTEALKYSDEIGEARIEANLGDYYCLLNKNDTAILQYFKALKIFSKNNQYYEVALIYLGIGKSFFKLQNLTKAELYVLKSINSSEKIGAKLTTMHAYELLTDIYYSKKNYLDAFKIQKKYIQLYKDFETEQSKKLMSELQIKFETEKNNHKILLKDAILKSRTNWLTIIIGILIVCFILLIYVLIQKKNLNIAYKNLVHQNIKITHSENSLIKTKAKLNKETNNHIEHTLNEDELTDNYNEFANQILELFETKKIYQDPDISISKIANMLNTNNTYVSQAINNVLNTRFNKIIHYCPVISRTVSVG